MSIKSKAFSRRRKSRRIRKYSVILCTVTIGALQSSIKYVHLGSPRSVGGWRTASLEVGGKRDESFLCL